MNTNKALFSELVYDFQSERWNESELPKLTLRELLALAKPLRLPFLRQQIDAHSSLKLREFGEVSDVCQHFFCHRESGHKQLTDFYLTKLAAVHEAKSATFDSRIHTVNSFLWK